MARLPIDSRSGILKALGMSCRDAFRREILLGHGGLNLNGIDLVEFVQPAPGANILRVHFLFDLPLGPDPYQLASANFPTIRIEGGERIVGITPQAPVKFGADPTKVLDIPVSAQGDFSTYWLSLGWVHVPADDSWTYTLAGVDRQFSVALINFRPGCPIDFDCAPATPLQPPLAPPPAIDYLAKDYASFRQLLLDLVTQRNPTWLETNAADLGITLLELLAYEGDYLSYFQDVVANEAFLDTVRKRISAKRHALLVDYHMHDGRNAWTYVHLSISPNSPALSGTVNAGQQLLTRIDVAIRPASAAAPPQLAPPPVMIDPTWLDFDGDPALANVKVFETAADTRFNILSNQLRIHTWGNQQCSLPVGTRVCHLFAIQPGVPHDTAVLPDLKPGDLLLLEEVISPFTGSPADADPSHRQVVRITRVDNVIDEVFDTVLDANDQLQIKNAAPLQLLEVAWDASDALTFCLCLSNVLAPNTVLANLSVARGNIVLADHGRTVNDSVPLDPPVAGDEKYLLTLARSPLTMQAQPTTQRGIVGSRTDLSLDVRSVTPAVQLAVIDAAGGPSQQWTPVPDLLESNEFANAFVVDVDDDGQGILRFGDDIYGRSIAGATKIDLSYRVGNGRIGNVGAEAIAHFAPRIPPPPYTAPECQLVRNPLPARDGTDPETIEQVRQYAPAAFHAVQYRAVTEADYVAAALTLDGVADAVAEFRWTGSWYTAFLGIDPTDPSNVTTEAGGRTFLTPSFALTIIEGLWGFKLAGYDIEVRSADYVSLDIEFQLCVQSDHFRADVVAAVLQALSNGVQADGTPGFFNPANFRFGQPVYLSKLYAAIAAVEGVDSAEVTVFQRYGQTDQGELKNGVIVMQRWEIARLANDVNLKENGVIKITADGGK